MKSMLRHAALLCCLAAVLACSGMTPTGTVKSFYRAVGDGEIDKAMGYLSDKTLAMGKDKIRAGLQNATRQILDKGGLQELQITSEKTAGDIATVSVLLRYGNETTDNENMNLVKEADGWRIEPRK